MGDLIVVTASRAVAEWARAVARARGPLGTQQALEPIVIWLGGDTVEALLDEQVPELALLAAWSMHRRWGARAEQVVRRALAITQRLPEPLRVAQERAILNVLSERMQRRLEEAAMDPEKFPEPHFMKVFRERHLAEGRAEGEARGEARGKAEGEARALLAVLAARRVELSDTQRARIESCRDADLLERWVIRAATATSAVEVLAD